MNLCMYAVRSGRYVCMYARQVFIRSRVIRHDWHFKKSLSLPGTLNSTQSEYICGVSSRIMAWWPWAPLYTITSQFHRKYVFFRTSLILMVAATHGSWPSDSRLGWLRWLELERLEDKSWNRWLKNSRGRPASSKCQAHNSSFGTGQGLLRLLCKQPHRKYQSHVCTQLLVKNTPIRSGSEATVTWEKPEENRRKLRKLWKIVSDD